MTSIQIVCTAGLIVLVIAIVLMNIWVKKRPGPERDEIEREWEDSIK